MTHDQWKFIVKYFKLQFKLIGAKKGDQDKIKSAVDGFNAKRCFYVGASSMKVLDEIMSDFSLQTTAAGAMPHISYIDRKPKPLGKS